MALFAAAICLCMLFTACSSPADTPPPDTREPIITSATISKSELQLPDETSVTLTTVATSADGSPAKAYNWTAVTALPDGAVITNADKATATVTGLSTAGTYKFQVEVTGKNDVKKTSSAVSVVVKAEEIVIPDTTPPTIASVTVSKPELQLPDETSVTLTTVAASADGSAPKAYSWTALTPLNGASIGDADKATATVTGLNTAGTYSFQVEVTGSNDIKKTSSPVSVVVKEEVVIVIPNVPPTVSADNPTSPVTLSATPITLSGTGADSDGTVKSYAWECTSYTKDAGVGTAKTPAQITGDISNTSNFGGTVALKQAGTYKFVLKVTDNEDAVTASNEVTVVVNPYQAPDPVTLTYPSFSVDTALNFNPTNLPAGITYTIASDTPTKTFTLGDGGFNGTVNISDGPYANFTTPAFTQIFKQDSVEVARQVIKVSVTGGKFQILKDSEGNNLAPQAIPSVTLNLEKTITELP
jgi:hypothetical protein